MSLRLFWKILLAFWLTLTVTTVGLIISFGGGDTVGMARIGAAFRGALSTGSARFPPVWPAIFHFVTGFVVSAVLAAYFARPISHLRSGFRRLATGQLDTRLTPGMGGRRDEIADLARDFDIMAERLQLLVAGRERLLHDVSHELRSPLARLSVAVGLAKRNDEISEAAFTRITTEAARLNAIVDDLLSIARAESDVFKEEIYFDIAELLEAICADARFEAQPRNVSVHLRLGPEFADPERAPLVEGAPDLLRRAIENVLRNALRFSPDNMAVEVDMAIEAASIVIRIRDYGPGVSEALIGHMFDPFVKGPGEARGVGLGLAIAQRAVAAHKGELRPLNAEGGGLLMCITLPLSSLTFEDLRSCA